MNRKLNETIATIETDRLINSTYPPAVTFGVYIRKGQGALTRGTLLARSSADGSMVVLGTTAESGETLSANCILVDDITVDNTVDTLGIAYRTGHFNEDALIVKDGYAVTEDDKEALREVGILLSDAIFI